MKTHESLQNNIFNVFHSFLKEGSPQLKPVLNSRSNVDTDQNKKFEKYLICKACENKITTLADKTKIDGTFQHSFLNPAGQVFEIGCFTDAIGCSIAGIPTSEWTWFSDYSWQIAICASCSSHLGWFYSGNKKLSFFGLILDTLI